MPSSRITVTGYYLVRIGHNENTKEFWEGLKDLVRSVPSGEKLYIGGDLNGHVGTSKT
jgi:hypothetical protein